MTWLERVLKTKDKFDKSDKPSTIDKKLKAENELKFETYSRIIKKNFPEAFKLESTFDQSDNMKGIKFWVENYFKVDLSLDELKSMNKDVKYCCDNYSMLDIVCHVNGKKDRFAWFGWKGKVQRYLNEIKNGFERSENVSIQLDSGMVKGFPFSNKNISFFTCKIITDKRVLYYGYLLEKRKKV